MSDKGNYLENEVKDIVEAADFNTQVREVINGFEIDVYAESDDLQLGLECKHHTNSSPKIRNLILEWEGKVKRTNLEELVLVLIDCNVNENHRRLANDAGIHIWTNRDLRELKNEESRSERREAILSKINREDLLVTDEELERVMRAYDVSSEKAEELVRNPNFKREKLEEIENFPHVYKNLDSRYRKKFENGEELYGCPMADIITAMAEYSINDPNKARILIDEGGSVKGHKYTKTRSKRIKMILENFETTFDKANQDLESINDKIYKKDLNRAIKAKKYREELNFLDSYRLVKEYSLTEIKSNEFNVEDAISDIKTKAKSDDNYNEANIVNRIKDFFL